jgi:hypothetical protein
MVWLAFRSGYASLSANKRPRLCVKAFSLPDKLLHRSWIAGVGLGTSQPADCRIAGLYHCFQGSAFMGKVTLGGFHQIRNQVVTPGQLHIDLRKGVLVAIARCHQSVVDRHEVQDNQNDNNQNNDQTHRISPPNGAFPTPEPRQSTMQFQEVFLLIAGALRAGQSRDLRARKCRCSGLKSPQRLQNHGKRRCRGTREEHPGRLPALAGSARRKRHAVAGLATAVVIDDKVAFERTVGYADASTKSRSRRIPCSGSPHCPRRLPPR